jgi:ATP-dependent Clp protease protease subunit
MDKSRLPKAPSRPSNASEKLNWTCSPMALQRWNAAVRAANGESDNSISILETIGSDFFGGGVTVKRISAALRAIGGGTDVVVNINSPGGDFFEGLAIYNVLREHKGKITVNILGIAASAAAVVAMAGDEVRIARAGFMMIHNTWVVAMGDRHDMREIADWLEPFDAAANDIFASRSGLEPKEVGKMLDREAWIGGAEAVDKGFADAFLASDEVTEDVENKTESLKVRAEKIIDAALARVFEMSRSKRREVMQQFKSGKRDAADDAMQDAGLSALTDLNQFLKGTNT